MASIKTTESAKSELFGLHYTVKHTGKMQGLQSISTSVTVNPYCIARRKSGDSICAFCFAAKMIEGRYKKDMKPCLENNARILTGSVIPVEYLPLIPVRYFRFESFGDLINPIQAINYINIAKKNPDTHCALWTKNPQIIEAAIAQGYRIPKNLQIVYSSPKVNKCTDINAIKARFPFINKVFTVYSPDYIKANGTNINCGAMSCLNCGKCYRKNPKGVDIMLINEKLK